MQKTGVRGHFGKMEISGERIPRQSPDCQNPNNNNLTSFHQLNSKIEVTENLIIMYTNSDCYLNKMSEIKLLPSTLTVKPHVIAITEVKYKNNRSFSVTESSLDCVTI